MDVQGIPEFLQRLEAAVLTASRYLADRRSGGHGPGSVRQLESLITYMKMLGENVRNQTVPAKNERMAKSKGWILVDDWDPEDPLGAEILDLNHYYIHEL